MIEPVSLFHGIWNFWIVFLLIWIGTVVPYRLSFVSDAELEKMDFFHIMDSGTDISFALDIMINFITAYENADGIIEYRLGKIA